jgi:hypothetical protein
VDEAAGHKGNVVLCSKILGVESTGIEVSSRVVENTA